MPRPSAALRDPPVPAIITKRTHFTHSFSPNDTQPHTHLLITSPHLSTHTPTASSSSGTHISNCHSPDTYANTQSHHVAVMKIIIIFTEPQIYCRRLVNVSVIIVAASSMYASATIIRQENKTSSENNHHNHRGRAPRLHRQPRHRGPASPPRPSFDAPPTTPSATIFRCLQNNKTHSSHSFSPNDIQPHTHLLITSPHLSTHTPTASSSSAPTFPTATALTHMQSHNHIISLS